MSIPSVESTPFNSGTPRWCVCVCVLSEHQGVCGVCLSMSVSHVLAPMVMGKSNREREREENVMKSRASKHHRDEDSWEQSPIIRQGKKQKQKKRDTRKVSTIKGESREKDTLFEQWVQQQNNHFASIDQTKLFDDSESYYRFVPDKMEQVVHIGASNAVAQEMTIEEIIKSSLSDYKRQDIRSLDLSFELGTTSTSTAATTAASSSFVSPSSHTVLLVPLSSRDLELKEQYPTLFNEYQEYCKAIAGIVVEPLSFSEFMEQNGNW
jgi:hypothetical protein